MKPMPHRAALAALCLAGAILAGCSKPAAPAPLAQATPEPTPEPTPKPRPVAVVATPPPATPEPVPATPEPNYFAPEGVYFLTVKKSVETSDGITGLRPGTRVEKQPDGSYKADGGLVVQAAAHEVTNDLRVAQHILASDAAASAALKAQMQQWHAAEASLKVPSQTPPPPGTRIYSSTTTTSDGRTVTHTTYSTSKTVTQPRRATPAPTPANPLARGAFGQAQAFKDRDGDGQKFGTSGRRE